MVKKRSLHRTFILTGLLGILSSPLARADAVADPRLSQSHDVDHPWMFDPHFADREQWEQRAKEVREQVLVAEGLWPIPQKTPLNAVIHGKVVRNGYTVERVFFASMPGHYVSGSLFRPTGRSGKLPAVLCPHGHWDNGRFYENAEAAARKQIEIGAEKTMEGARFPIQARCAMLAQMGCVVFHYDMVGYADSTAIEHRAGFTDAEAILRLQSFMGLQTWNSIRALDFVLSLPDVDPKRIAITGASGGGTQTMILDAIDDRVAVAFPAVMVSEAMQGGCICENAPLLRVHTNNVEFAATFAPKPEGMTSANDWTRELLTKGFPQLQTIYRLFGAQEDVMAWYRPFEHNYNQVSRELMYNWMNRHLKLGLPEPVTEKPFVALTREELTVYDSEHPRPSDSLDAAALRKRMTTDSNAQLAKLAADPVEYRKVVAGALRVMIGDELPAASDVAMQSAGESTANATTTQTGVILRHSSGVRLPYVLLTPEGWNGTIALWVDPRGKTSIYDGQKLGADVRQLLARKSALLAIDVFLTGDLSDSQKHEQRGKYANYAYGGYYFGYNPSTFANRASDVLTAIGAAKHIAGANGVQLVAFHAAGSWALLACALAGDAVSRAAIDLDNFDFNQVKESDDQRMLPGALKYGGARGFAPLCDKAKVAVWNAPSADWPEVAGSGAMFHPEEGSPQVMLQWLAQGR